MFVDDSLSAFRFNDLVALGCDSLVEWTDFDPEAARPYGNRAVWAGYDPQNSEDGDNAALVIMAPPTSPGGKFRILERHQLRGLDFEQQAEFIKAVLSRYTVTYLGIDATGVGAGVHQLLAKPDSGIGGVTKIEYIMYATGEIDVGDTDKLKEAMKAAKGPGNFRSMFVHAPNGREQSIRIIPIAEAAAKDEFLGIKSASAADVMASHRVPPQLLGIVPAQGSAFGNPVDAVAMFERNEIRPLKAVFLDLNDRMGVPAVTFEDGEVG